MTESELLQFLKDHQPMPGDNEISNEEGSIFSEALRYFEDNPNPECIPLFMNSVSKNTRLGMYEHIKFVLLAHDRASVMSHLRVALGSESVGVQERACWWAHDLLATEYLPSIRQFAFSKDEEVREAADSFLELVAEDARHQQ